MVSLLLKASHNKQCAVICFLWAKGLTVNDVYSQMCPVYGDKCLQEQQYTFSVISLLVGEKVLLMRNHVVATINALITTVNSFRPVCINFRHVLHTGISVHRIVHDHLKFRTVSARWVLKQLQSEQLDMRLLTYLDTCCANRQKQCWRELSQATRRGYTIINQSLNMLQCNRSTRKLKELPTATKFNVVPSVNKVIATGL